MCKLFSDGVLAASSVVCGRNKTPWKYCLSSLVGRTSGHNIFTNTTGVPKYRNYSTYDAYKHLTPEVNFRLCVKYINDETHRRENDFYLSMCELESFIAIQYARGLFTRSTDHPLFFFTMKFHIFQSFGSNVTWQIYAILKYLRCDEKPNRWCTGPGADRLETVRVVFQGFALMCQCKRWWKFSLTVDKQLMLLRSRFLSLFLW